MKTIVIKRADGGVSIMEVAKSANVDGLIEAWESAAFKDGGDKNLEYLSHRVVDKSKLPSDETFFNAWTDDFDTDTVDVNMDKAKQIHLGVIREARNKKLTELDIETMKGNDVQVEKQILRDLPDNIQLDNITTPEELKAIWPDELN